MPHAVVTAAYHMWWGGFSSPARFIGATLLVFAVAHRRGVGRRDARGHAGRAGGGPGRQRRHRRHAAGRRARGVRLQRARRGGALACLGVADGGSHARGPEPVPARAPRRARRGGGVDGGARRRLDSARAAARAGSLKPGSAALAVLCGLGLAVTVAAEATWRIEGASGTRVTVRATARAGGRRHATRLAWGGARFAGGDEGRAGDRAAAPGRRTCRQPVRRRLARAAVPPAGRYRLWADLSAAAAFEIQLVAGRSEGPFDSWAIARDGAGAREPGPRAARRCVGSARARRCRRQARRARHLAPAGRRGGGPPPVAARRAASAMRYGGLVVYAAGECLPRAGRAVDGGRADGRARRAGGRGRQRRGRSRCAPGRLRHRCGCSAGALTSGGRPGARRGAEPSRSPCHRTGRRW
ncbi:MAG: hypothetical protein M0C28_18205 [Candidatus Moduliflexus flocculans]|nr:hypothetical protein [Candidatus Moduliflexus flocculans]